MAYAIINKLKTLEKHSLLQQLTEGVQVNEKKKGKKHQVFRLSFDARLCLTEKMLEQKLDYIHHNPVSGKWNLVDDFTRYLHSSAAYYELGSPNRYVTHYREVSGGWICGLGKIPGISESSSRDSEGGSEVNGEWIWSVSVFFGEFSASGRRPVTLSGVSSECSSRDAEGERESMKLNIPTQSHSLEDSEREAILP